MHCMCEHRRVTVESVLSPSTFTWVLDSRLGGPGCGVNAFTSLTILLVPVSGCFVLFLLVFLDSVSLCQ